MVMIQSPLLRGVPQIQHGFGSKSPALRAAFADHWPARAIQRERHGPCTICADAGSAAGPTFHSYRRDLATRVPSQDIQWSAIMLNG